VVSFGDSFEVVSLVCFRLESVMVVFLEVQPRDLYLAAVLNTDSDLMANMYIVLNCRRKLLEHAYGYYGMELKLAFSSL